MESVLGFTLMATRVNILYDRGISEARRKLASAGVCTQPSAVSVIRYGQKILTKLEDNLRMIEMFCHVGGEKKPKPASAREERKPSAGATQHKSSRICLSALGESRTQSECDLTCQNAGFSSFCKSVR